MGDMEETKVKTHNGESAALLVASKIHGRLRCMAEFPAFRLLNWSVAWSLGRLPGAFIVYSAGQRS